MPQLNESIENLLGPKFIFTNGTKSHAENVLKKLGLENVFKSIFDIKSAQYIPKPNIETYNLFFKTMDVDPKTAIMFEDMGRNLIPAKELGITTVLIKREIPNQDNIFQDKKYSDIWDQDIPADYTIFKCCFYYINFFITHYLLI